jgi:hypothetical protein
MPSESRFSTELKSEEVVLKSFTVQPEKSHTKTEEAVERFSGMGSALAWALDLKLSQG